MVAMIKIDSSNLEKVKPPHGLQLHEVRLHAGFLPDYLKKIHDRKQGFYRVIDDSSALENIKKYAASVSGKFKSVVVLGIGGSALGALTLRDALCSSKNPVRMHVLDNIDPSFIQEVEDAVDYETTLFIVISKSGGTVETLSQYRYFKSKGAKHFVFVTDPIVGELRKIANAEKIQTFPVPPDVGGRFSVLTAVGLLPAALLGINIDELLKGAREMRDYFLKPDFEKNMPFQLAAMQYLLWQKGKSMNVMMPYSQRLFRFSDWFRQLLAESTGKEKKQGHKTLNVGITPINALGVTDQHSQLQLYSDGPNDKFFIFLKLKNPGPRLQIPGSVTFTELMHAEMAGTVEALTQCNRPNIVIDVDDIDAKTLGALFMLFQGATAFLGEFFGVDAFNQPGVELSKKLAREALKK